MRVHRHHKLSLDVVTGLGALLLIFVGRLRDNFFPAFLLMALPSALASSCPRLCPPIYLASSPSFLPPCSLSYSVTPCSYQRHLEVVPGRPGQLQPLDSATSDRTRISTSDTTRVHEDQRSDNDKVSLFNVTSFLQLARVLKTDLLNSREQSSGDKHVQVP